MWKQQMLLVITFSSPPLSLRSLPGNNMITSTKKNKVTERKHKHKACKANNKEMLIPAIIIKPLLDVLSKQKRRRLKSKNSGRPKGLLAVVKSCVLNSRGEVPIKLVDAKSAAKVVCQGGDFGGDVVVIHENNQVTPGYLPELSDIAHFPAALKIATKWIIANHGGAGGIGFENIIPGSITSLIAGATPTIQTAATAIQSTLVTIGTTDQGRSGTMCGRNKLVVWNCKSMAKETFLEEFANIVELHMPDVVVLTETRVSVHMARVICHGLHPFAVYGSSKTVVDGGHAIVVFRKENTLQLIDSFSDTKTWQFIN